MIYILVFLSGAIVFMCGYGVCYYTTKKSVKPQIKTSQKAIQSKVGLSLKSPLQTYEKFNKEYADKQTGFFKPKGQRKSEKLVTIKG